MTGKRTPNYLRTGNLIAPVVPKTGGSLILIRSTPLPQEQEQEFEENKEEAVFKLIAPSLDAFEILDLDLELVGLCLPLLTIVTTGKEGAIKIRSYLKSS